MEVGNQHLFNLSAKSLYTLISERNKAVILKTSLSAIDQRLRFRLKRTSVKNRFIEVYYLPSHCLDLNPDEFLNCDLKTELAK
ncbi:MAG: hypothetical protein ACI8Z5_001124 [Lentimonas sp.]|jgi:hypothetical protein